MISTTEFMRSTACPYAARLGRLYAYPESEALSFGSAFHRFAAGQPIGLEDRPEEAEKAAKIGARWLKANRSQYQGVIFDEVSFFLKITSPEKSPRLSLTTAEKAPKQGLVIASVLDAIGIEENRITIYERKTTSRTDLDTVVSEYFSGHQICIYSILAQYIETFTGRKTRIVLDVIRKALPSEPHLNKCTCARKAAGIDPACPKCYGTGVEKISEMACDTTPQAFAEIAAKYPHLEPQATERARLIAERGDTFFRFESLPVPQIPTGFIGALARQNRRINAEEPEKSFVDCFKCSYFEGCRTGIFSQAKATRPEPLNDLISILNAVKRGKIC